jgi:hypothetical protein
VPDAVPEGPQYGVVIIDPPYIPSQRVAHYPTDPTRTIDGGPDGLELAETAMRAVVARHPDTDVVLQLGSWEQADVLTERLDGDVRMLGVRSVRDDRLLVHLATAASAGTTTGGARMAGRAS